MKLRPDINFKNIPKAFIDWFKENENFLLWDENAMGYVATCDINLINLDLTFIPIQFHIVNGNFDCSYNMLSSLKGCPSIVNGSFDCSNNNLISLEFGPKIVKKSYYCYSNKLKSLKGCPETVLNFSCSNNNLKSLKYGPKIVNGTYACDNNQLKSLKYCPEIIYSKLLCHNNNIETLQPIKIVYDELNCSYNNIKSLKNCPNVGTTLCCYSNKLDNDEFVKINCKEFICDDSYKKSKTYRYWEIKHKLKNI